jgi:hypothetical protein
MQTRIEELKVQREAGDTLPIDVDLLLEEIERLEAELLTFRSSSSTSN